MLRQTTKESRAHGPEMTVIKTRFIDLLENILIVAGCQWLSPSNPVQVRWWQQLARQHTLHFPEDKCSTSAITAIPPGQNGCFIVIVSPVNILPSYMHPQHSVLYVSKFR